MNQRQLGVVLPIVASLAISGSAPWALAQSAQPPPIRIGFTRVGSLVPMTARYGTSAAAPMPGGPLVTEMIAVAFRHDNSGFPAGLLGFADT